MKRTMLSLAAVLSLAACMNPYPPPPFEGPPPPPEGLPPEYPPPEGPPRGAALPTEHCFRTVDIRNHTVADSRTLLLHVRGHGVYRVAMRGACLAGAISSDPLVMRQPPGSSVVCRPIDLDVGISRSGSFAVPCIVDAIELMTPEEVDALPPRLRP